VTFQNNQKLNINVRYLPPGTAVNVPPYIIHRDEKNFSPLPETFWPDRWLSAQQRKAPAFLTKADAERFNVNDVTTNHSVFIPFSYGPANCVGKNLAILELRTIVSLLVRRFDMTFGVDGAGKYNPDQWEAEGEDWFVFKNGKLPVVLTRRD
jgi:cytochrome P450